MTQLYWSNERLLPGLEDRLRTAIRIWEGTPYHEGAQVPRAGVDCWRFVSAVADDMRQRPRIKLPRIVADAAMHSPETARAAMRWALREHDCEDIGGVEVRPGDVVVAGPHGGGPGHAMLAGPDGFLWHVTQAQGVCATGLSFHGLTFYTILRVRKNIWPSP